MGWYTEELWADPLSDDGEGEAEWADWIVEFVVGLQIIWEWNDKLVPYFLMWFGVVLMAIGAGYLGIWIGEWLA